MSSTERALQAVRAMTQFEIAQAGAEVAQTAEVCACEARKLADSARRCESSAGELRRTLPLPGVNPELLRAMHRLYQQERRDWTQSRARHDVARHNEERAREALAELRNRESSLDKALQLQRGQRRLARQAVEMQRADDLWLQRLPGMVR
jgi:hypothetical protein